jgi:rubrerythrin
MEIREALNTAIEYEKRVVDTYAAALAGISDPAGQRIFKLMEAEEKDHVAYLEAKLGEFLSSGSLSSSDLGTKLPPIEKIKDAVKSLEEKMADADFKSELEMLQKARDIEIETSSFYHRMVEELPDEGKAFFKRFVEIEDGHVALVEAEIEYLQHKGAWLSVDDGDLRFF